MCKVGVIKRFFWFHCVFFCRPSESQLWEDLPSLRASTVDGPSRDSNPGILRWVAPRTAALTILATVTPTVGGPSRGLNPEILGWVAQWTVD